MEKKLRKAIKNALNQVTAKNCPYVCDFISTQNGYKRIEDMIINMMIKDNITALGSITAIEQSLAEE